MISAAPRGEDAARARVAAAAHAQVLLAAGAGPEALPECAAVLLAGLAAEGLLADRVAGAPILVAAGADDPHARLGLGLRALGDPMLAALPLLPAVDAQLTLLGALVPLRRASVWVVDANGDARLLGALGKGGTEAEKKAAGAVLAGRPAPLPGASGPAVAPIACGERTCAALVWQAAALDAAALAAALASRAGAMLAPPFAAASLVERNVAGQRALVGATERRLARLGLDLHDGALQHLALLRGEIAAFHEQIGDLGDPTLTRLVQGRAQDLGALASSIEADLRELATSLESPTLAHRPFAEVLDGVIRAFAERSGVEPEVELLGDASRITTSQRIALLRIIQEALSNVREHSEATRVGIRIETGNREVTAIVRDDGKGFDVKRTMRRAGRKGRIGLLGMVERVRLLGGQCEIASAPAAGTVITLRIPRSEVALEPGAPAPDERPLPAPVLRAV